jgi:hypothetical protein
MILYELKCGKDHQFEGWFRSGAAYESQLAAQELSCPMCGDRSIDKAIMAPRIGKSAGVPVPVPVPAAPPAAAPAPTKEQAAEMLKMLRALREKVEKECDYVGPAFAEEARRIHYGEAEERAIYGEASEEDAESLREDGVPVSRIPWVPRHDA